MNHLIRQMMMFGSRRFRVGSITRTGGGGQYGGTPSVVFSGGGGTGYVAAPTISFSGGSPSVAATATANMISE